MAKDPAFLFYYQDFLVGTDDFSNEEAGAYIRCLCHQAHKDVIAEKHLRQICKKKCVAEKVLTKFTRTENGGLFNERLKKEKKIRVDYCNSRRKNAGKIT